ncbi:MAG: DUF4375 domain-containing protein [Oscillospiraceae bacterium]|nr:DUF4375 domain-containing protein [Oscillospiraceae bacterium]
MQDHDLWNFFVGDFATFAIKNPNHQFNDEQKNALIALWYDGSVQNGGHMTFLDFHSKIYSNDEVAHALREVGGEKFASNFLSAVSHMYYDEEVESFLTFEEEDPVEDDIYYNFSPTLCDLLEQYIHINKEKIFI